MGSTMALLQQPEPVTTRVESRICPQTSRVSISFEITSYRLHQNLASGFVRSSSVNIGGYDWCLRDLPDCDIRGVQGLHRSLPRAPHRERRGESEVPRPVFITKDGITNRGAYGINNNKFLKKTELEAPSSEYLRDDHLVIECHITVVKPPLVLVLGTTTSTTTRVVNLVPRQDLSHDLATLLEKKDGADVIFHVRGQAVATHTAVLAARSPVFNAEFFGPMRRQASDHQHHVTVEDMEPAAFKALIHFIYTDSTSPLDGLDDKVEKQELTNHLLVAADRYAVQGLKVLCEKSLSESLDAETVAPMLALADQDSCSELKHACVEFITSSEILDRVVASDGYRRIKESCPTVVVDFLEIAAKRCRI
ncbi:hypothetical protein ACP4OV_027005 [Aristida adscensionis]